MIHGLHNMLPNEVLGRLLETNLRRVGGFVYSDEEIAFSKTIQATLASPRPIGAQENVEPWNPRPASKAGARESELRFQLRSIPSST